MEGREEAGPWAGGTSLQEPDFTANPQQSRQAAQKNPMFSDELEQNKRAPLICIAFNQLQAIYLRGVSIVRCNDTLSEKAQFELNSMIHQFLNYLAHVMWDLDQAPRLVRDFAVDDSTALQEPRQQEATVRCAERVLRRTGYVFEDRVYGWAYLPDEKSSQTLQRAEGCAQGTAGLDQSALLKRRGAHSQQAT